MMCTKVPVDARQDSVTDRRTTVRRHTGLHALCVCQNDKRIFLSDNILQKEAARSPAVAARGPPGSLHSP